MSRCGHRASGCGSPWPRSGRRGTLAGMTKPAMSVDQSMTAESAPVPTTSADVRLDDDLLPFHEIEGEGFDLEERQSLRRVAGIRTDLEDVTEVEYRQLRLERVVLMGVYEPGDAAE